MAKINFNGLVQVNIKRSAFWNLHIDLFLREGLYFQRGFFLRVLTCFNAKSLAKMKILFRGD